MAPQSSKNTETRNKFIPSHEIFAPSSEIIIKIVNYCRKMIKNHGNNDTIDQKNIFEKIFKKQGKQMICKIEI